MFRVIAVKVLSTRNSFSEIDTDLIVIVLGETNNINRTETFKSTYVLVKLKHSMLSNVRVNV